MRINSVLLLIFGFILVFAPTLKEWLYSSDEIWLYHHLIWLLAIAGVYLNNRRYSDNGF